MISFREAFKKSVIFYTLRYIHLVKLTLLRLKSDLDEVHRDSQAQLRRPRHAARAQHGEVARAEAGGSGDPDPLQGPGVHPEEDGVDGPDCVEGVGQAAHQGSQPILEIEG